MPEFGESIGQQITKQIIDLAVKLESVNGKVEAVASDITEVKSDIAEAKDGIKHQNGRVRDIERKLIAEDATKQAITTERQRVVDDAKWDVETGLTQTTNWIAWIGLSANVLLVVLALVGALIELGIF